MRRANLLAAPFHMRASPTVCSSRPLRTGRSRREQHRACTYLPGEPSVPSPTCPSMAPRADAAVPPGSRRRSEQPQARLRRRQGRRRSAGHPEAMIPSAPRRQQWRRLRTAANRAALAALVLVLAAAAASAGYFTLATALAFASCRSLQLAARSGVGAASEALVRRALASLEREGWHVRHSLDWPGRGDLDHVVRAPSGVGFLVETKTMRCERTHLVRVASAARWLSRRRWRYPGGVRPVICIARARHVERFDGEVLVVSLDRLVPALYRAAGLHGRLPSRRGVRTTLGRAIGSMGSRELAAPSSARRSSRVA